MLLSFFDMDTFLPVVADRPEGEGGHDASGMDRLLLVLFEGVPGSMADNDGKEEDCENLWEGVCWCVGVVEVMLLLFVDSLSIFMLRRRWCRLLL